MLLRGPWSLIGGKWRDSNLLTSGFSLVRAGVEYKAWTQKCCIPPTVDWFLPVFQARGQWPEPGVQCLEPSNYCLRKSGGKSLASNRFVTFSQRKLAFICSPPCQSSSYSVFLRLKSKTIMSWKETTTSLTFGTSEVIFSVTGHFRGGLIRWRDEESGNLPLKYIKFQTTT